MSSTNPTDPQTSIPSIILTPQGVQNPTWHATSLAEAAAFEPAGVYTVGRTFKRIGVLLFEDHLNRLEESAALQGIPVRLDRTAIRHALRTLIDQSGYELSRFRITVPQAYPDQVVITLEPFTPLSPAVIENGVRVVTTTLTRHNPRAKATQWMQARKSATESLPAGAYEALLVSPEGFLLEGTSSNFYAITDGKLHTAAEGVLPGMAQKIVFQVAPAILPLDLTPVRADQLWALDEAFLTSASRGVVPIVMINTQVIGTGQPGPTTLRLQAAYEDWAESHLETLPLSPG
ncbi:Branched-chain-amino-acid aminotransferase [Anaerolineae bacterium]|nr:Branched-chain-amino-acid aminotransferase [Anaerolineae bacterium]